MGASQAIVAAIDFVARETLLFAGVGFLIGGLDDLAVDLVFVGHRVRKCRDRWQRGLAWGQGRSATLDAYPVLGQPGRLAIFVAAWDEAAVIGRMLTTALARFDHPDYRIYVGTYPNDRATIDAVSAVAVGDPRVRLVIGPRDGPTTKADCLNALWRALGRDEIAEGVTAKAIILHDAEDSVDRGELRLYDALIDRYAVVQLPVVPLIVPGSRFISGHYLDEFAEAHSKQLIVRQVLGAGLPLAGVGCAIARGALQRIADARGGVPFDAASLTEDYELGLQLAANGGRAILARVYDQRGGALVAVRAHFPATLDAAVRQKARWMTGIALAGWDRVGWSGALDWREHWMRMRDRRGPIAVLILFVAYVAMLAWAVSLAAHALVDMDLPTTPGLLRWILFANALLLAWRLAMRGVCTGAAYGVAEGLWALPRTIVANYIALLAARRAMVRYIGMLRGAPPAWEKTVHSFPDDAADAA